MPHELPDPQLVFEGEAELPVFRTEDYSYVPSQYLMHFRELLIRFFSTTLQELRSGDIGVNTFCEVLQPISRYGVQ